MTDEQRWIETVTESIKVIANLAKDTAADSKQQAANMMKLYDRLVAVEKRIAALESNQELDSFIFSDVLQNKQP